MPHRRRPFTLVEWLIVLAIAGVLFAIIAPAQPGRRSRRVAPAAPAAPAVAPQPAIPVGVPHADKRVTLPPSAFRLWQRVQNPLALVLALHVIGRALRRDRRQHRETPIPTERVTASGPPPRGEDV
jgi:prepilin-type N-terminal cleavage/methylation domain-containing protein